MQQLVIWQGPHWDVILLHQALMQLQLLQLVYFMLVIALHATQAKGSAGSK
jgi:hypothetical protein